MLCSYSHCLKNAQYKTLKLCNTHYYRVRRNGSLKLKIHKQSRTKMYRRWNSMRQRCENPNDQAYKNYGGRGIKVCERWRNYFDFLEDVGLPPTTEHTLDRIDNDGNYEPKNVRWALRDVQTHNQRNRSKTGYKGVYEFRGKYRAGVRRNGKQFYSGGHLTAEDAHEAYLILEKQAYGH